MLFQKEKKTMMGMFNATHHGDDYGDDHGDDGVVVAVVDSSQELVVVDSSRALAVVDNN